MAAAHLKENRWAMILLGCGLLGGLVARLVFAFNDDGMWWPDEYYQSLEPAHRAVFGYGFQAWEFLDGARHWALPGFIAALMKSATFVGVDYLTVIRVTFCLAGIATAAASYRLARAQGASSLSSATGATVFALMGLAVYAAPRAMGETLSALPVTLAFALLIAPSSRRQVALAGLLFSLAVGLRLQNGLFCLAAVALLLKQRRQKELAVLLGTLSLGALIFGAIDHLTWGSPFHSALAYLRFNVLEGRSSQFGTHPVWHYLRALVTAEGLTLIPLFLLTGLGTRKQPAISLIILVYLIVHSLIPHKELRFLFPIFPLLCAQAALGLDEVNQHKRLLVTGVMVGLSLVSLALLPTLTFSRLGISNPKSTSALDYGGPENRLLLKARPLTDLCGLKVASLDSWRTGGYAYLHRSVPMFRTDRNDDPAYFNYLIARRHSVAGIEVAIEGDLALLKVADNCAPNPNYDWHLE